MYWHIDTDIVSLIVIVIVYVCNRKLPPQGRDSLRNERFARCLEVGIFVTLIDIAASVIMEVPTTRFLYHLLMTAYFVSLEFVIVDWLLYVLTILYQDDEKKRRTLSRIALSLFAVYAVFCCANPWTGLIYTLGANNEYSRGPLFAVMLVLFSMYSVFMLALMLIRWKNIPKEFPSHVLLMMPIVIALAIVFQLSNPGWLLILPAYMICLVLAFLFLQTMHAENSQKLMENLWTVAETDKLTGLLNRVGMEAMVRQTLENAYGAGVVVLLADIDNLKDINDSMGHAEGDRAIKLIAQQLKRHFRAGDMIARYGGDEFLVFFTGSFSESQLDVTLSRLVTEFNGLYIGEKNDVPLCGSIGATFGIVGSDTFEQLCAQADTALYYVKRNGKNGYAQYRPEMGKTVSSEER